MSRSYPKYFYLLSPADQEAYMRIKEALSFHICRNVRNKRIETFSEILSIIKAFCVKNNQDDWKRSIACGICWLYNGIAINTRQLSFLIDKCKSSINGSLQKIGYSTLQNRENSSTTLIEAIPFFRNNFSELREWTVRLFVAATPQPAMGSCNFSNKQPFTSPAPRHYPLPLPTITTKKEPEEKLSVSHDSENQIPDIFIDSNQETIFDDPFCCAPSCLYDEQEDNPSMGDKQDSIDNQFMF